ncbi:hypothetical protein PIB30_102527 [Stylosanthes scabra]|uniref:Protein FAR1-RELATED SEQUENCE n=1 Tax=Stylosanthes scabra TaxID=79078 RepID=A0ABU6TX81_9FABA|nr:hypothetical protein [Stylosanthes scabra]
MAKPSLKATTSPLLTTAATSTADRRGILCRYSLMVLSHERVYRVSSRYILERWSKTVKRNHTNIRSSYDEPVLDERVVIYKGLLSRSFEMCEFGSESKGLAAILYRAFDKAYVEMVEFKAKEKKGKSIITHEEGSLNDMNELHSPTRVRLGGRLKKRLSSTLK